MRGDWILGVVYSVGCMAACTANQSEVLSKDEAQRQGGKGDVGDFCAYHGWYGDGECDRFCPRFDEDCGDGPEAGCDPQNATATGRCPTKLGVRWDGENCVDVRGCNCRGDDCSDLYRTQSECASARMECSSETACGGWLGTRCDGREVCHYEEDQDCGAGDQSGVCQPRPDACPAVLAPVCGCNGTTYNNQCEASHAGTSVAHSGECPRSCESNSDCASRQWCDFREEAACGAGGIAGVCRPRPITATCSRVADPVCGCDGKTYHNSCHSTRVAVDIAHDGPC